MTEPKQDYYTLTIPDERAGERLDQVLAGMIPSYSRTQIQEAITTGAALIDNRPAQTKLRVKGGEQVTITLRQKDQPAFEAQNIPLVIIHEDDSLIILNKPAGLVVHPGAGNKSKTLLNALLHHCPDLGRLPRAGILHRLDKETSGLLVIAKTDDALRQLNMQLKKRTLLREYQAVVSGTMISGGIVDAPIARHHHQRKRMAVDETGKVAITHYRVAEKFRAHTRLKLRLETGRTHQIRVHMTHIRHPVVGDPVYGGRMRLVKGMSEDLIHVLRGFKRQALHAFAIGLIHPVTKEFMHWEIDLPKDMLTLTEALRADIKREPTK